MTPTTPDKPKAPPTATDTPAAPAAAAPDPSAEISADAPPKDEAALEPNPDYSEEPPAMTAGLFCAGNQADTVAVAGLLADTENKLTADSELTRDEWRAAVDKYLKTERP